MLKKYSELAEMFARLVAEEGDQNVVIDWWKEETIVEVLNEIDMDDFDQDAKENLEFLRETPFEVLEKMEERLCAGGVLPPYGELEEFIINLAEGLA